LNIVRGVNQLNPLVGWTFRWEIVLRLPIG